MADAKLTDRDVSPRSNDPEGKGAAERKETQQTAYISLDADGAPAPPQPRSPKRAIAAGVVAALCAVLAIVSLGFVYPAADGSWSLAWLFETTSSTGDDVAAGADDEGADADASDATDGATDEAQVADAADAASDAAADTASDVASTQGDSSSSTAATAGAPSGSTGASTDTSRDSTGASSTGGATSAPAQTPAPAAPAPATVTVSVSVSSSAAGNPVSASGTYTFEEGATVYDALMALGLSVNAQSTAFGVYVSAIGGLAEFDHGSGSGWVYTVNGQRINVSASSCTLHDGDSVSWFYVV